MVEQEAKQEVPVVIPLKMRLLATAVEVERREIPEVQEVLHSLEAVVLVT